MQDAVMKDLNAILKEDFSRAIEKLEKRATMDTECNRDYFE